MTRQSQFRPPLTLALDEPGLPEFEAQVVAFIQQHWQLQHARPDRARRLRFAMVEQGWSVPNWPSAAGGCHWSLAQRWLFFSLCGSQGVDAALVAGQDFVGPLLLAEAASAVGERQLFLETRLAALLEAREWWVIGRAPAATIESPTGGGAQRVSGRVELQAPVQAMDWLCIETGPRWCVVQAPAAARVHLLLQDCAVLLEITAEVSDVQAAREAEWFYQAGVLAAESADLGTLAPVEEAPVDGEGGRVVDEWEAWRMDRSHLEVELLGLQGLVQRYLMSDNSALRWALLEPARNRTRQTLTQLGDLQMRGFGYDALPFEDEFARHNEADLGAGGLKIERAMQNLGGGVQVGFDPVFVPRPEEDNDETAAPGDWQ